MNKNTQNINQFLDLIINQLSTAVFVINQEGQLIYKNEMFDGYTLATSSDNNTSYIFDYFPQDENNRLSQLIKTTFNFGYSEAELNVAISNQRIRRFFVAMTKVVHQGASYGIGELQDVSIRSKSEEELKKALTSLQELTDELERENTYLREEVLETSELKEVITQNDEMKNILHNIKQVAITDAPAYILGENGTGKELTGRLIHQLSKRQHKPFVKINCDSLSPSVLEQELFGREESHPFKKRKMGKLEIANGGTIYLKRINKLTPPLQVKLLGALQREHIILERENKSTILDIRLITSSNESLARLVENNQFSEELYYKLCVFPLHLPPLRTRRDDIPLLINHFTSVYNRKYNFKISRIPKKLIADLVNYEWPGNVRELKSLVERAVISSKGSRLEFRERLTPIRKAFNTNKGFASWNDHEREYLKKVLEHTTWRIRGPYGAAALLKLKPTTLESKMKRLGIHKPHPKNE
ncbi:sigma 54-interacting transcriptional regulator [Sunxiuqinia elliptica]